MIPSVTADAIEKTEEAARHYAEEVMYFLKRGDYGNAAWYAGCAADCGARAEDYPIPCDGE